MSDRTSGRRFYAALDLLDRQIIDADGMNAGKVDDLEFVQPEGGGAPYVEDILSGLGALGPRIMATGANGLFLSPPQMLLDNPDTWLDMTDLVFVDPVGTGYSHAAAGQEARSFWGINPDAASLGAFIRLYLTQAGRTRSPE